MIKKIFNRYVLRVFGNHAFPGSPNYWETRYITGDNSGQGSYGKLANFKAEVVNEFIHSHKIKTVIEFGCGDGNQLSMLKALRYIGLDVSKTAIKMCQDKFNKDKTKKFFLYDQNDFKENKSSFNAELGLSLDVIYHLIEDGVFTKHMNDLLNSSSEYVIIYASNKNSKQNYHIKHREFVSWIKNNRPEWKFIKKINNKYPKLSFADFYVFKKTRAS